MDMITSAAAQVEFCWQHFLVTDTAEGAHKLRVAVRRLRVVLHSLRRKDAHRFTDVRSSLADAARTVGRLRDIDVLADDIVKPLLDADAPAGGEALLAQLATERRAVRIEVCAALDTAEMLKLRDALSMLSLRLEPGVAKDFHDRALRKLALRDLRQRWRHFMRRADDLESLTPEDLHEARKSLKSLRYALGHFAPVLDPADLARFQKHMQKLLDLFGYLNDVESAKVLATRLDPAPERFQINCLIGYVLGMHTERARRARKKLASHLQRLAQSKFARALAHPD